MKNEETKRRRPRRASAKLKDASAEPEIRKSCSKPRRQKAGNQNQGSAKKQADTPAKQGRAKTGRAGASKKEDTPGPQAVPHSTVLLNRQSQAGVGPELQDQVQQTKPTSAKNGGKEKDRSMAIEDKEAHEVK